MESAAISQLRFPAPPSPSALKQHSNGIPSSVFCSFPVQNFQKKRKGLRLECSIKGSELRYEEEMNEIKKLIIDENCSSERDDAVELLECLEKEALIGEDKGRNPDDYNRRSQIFDTSSKVFQALKHSQNTSSV